MKQTISKFMTPLPHTINARARLSAARALMSQHGIRHLPVLEGGRLVGLLSQRDIQLLEAIAPKEAASLAVEEAMSQEVLTVAPEAPLPEVAAAMAERKYGSAVVMGEHVLGIFTTTDALKCLAGPAPSPRKAPSRPKTAALKTKPVRKLLKMQSRTRR